MLTLVPERRPGRPLRLVCIGAHSDDLEIGCGATILKLLRSEALDVTWVVLSGEGLRGVEARSSATTLLKRAVARRIVIAQFRDCHFPNQYSELKAYLEDVSRASDPDVVFTHRLEDRHQDHRLVAELTWNAWRNHLILEYEIAKYEGDLATPNAYVPIPAALARRKVEHLLRQFASQRSKDWFTRDSFLALMRIRGIESRSTSGLAEAFHARKLTLL